MKVLALDHLVCVVPDLGAAAPYEKLGFTLTPPMEHKDGGTANRVFFVGSGKDHFYAEFLAVTDAELAAKGGRQDYVDLAGKSGGVARLMLEVDDLDAWIEVLRLRGVECLKTEAKRGDGSKICEVAIPQSTTPAGCSFGLISYVLPRSERTASRKSRGVFDHSFPASRLDHLALVTHNPAECEAFWTSVLGIPVVGRIKVEERGFEIVQLESNGAVLELLCPLNETSPIRGRPEGLVPMIAVEVSKLNEAVETARKSGFEVPDGAKGVLPGTRTATIPGDKLGGLALQLLERVD